jgi:CheY-like chemotaxis protein
MSKSTAAKEMTPVGADARLMDRAIAKDLLRRRILIVDDEPLLLSLMARVLEGEHEVVEACGGRTALAAFERGERFDLVLCDVIMPDIGGAALYRRVAAIAPDQAACFVFLSGGAVNAGIAEFLEAHQGRRLDKPMSMQELRSAVRRWLSVGKPS